MPSVRSFPVERGHISIFARAIGDEDPVHHDPEAAAASPLGGIIAPPTFVEAAQYFDPDFPYRPRPGRPWFGSAAEPSGAPPPVEIAGTSFHAETHFVYHRHVRPGDVLHTRERAGKTWTRQGRRGGTLEFAETITEYVDADGRPVVTATVVAVTTEHVVDPGAGSDA